MTQCQRCGKNNVDIHTCTPINNIARGYDIGEITQKLTIYWLDNPDLRFGQMLVNIGYLKTDDCIGFIEDPYNYYDSELLDILTVIEKG